MRELPHFRELAVAWRGHLPAATGMALTALLALQAARLGWIVLAPVGPFGAFPPMSQATTTAVAPLATWGDPFHRRDIATTTSPGGITLHGVRLDDSASSAAPSSAILDVGSGQSSWRVGETVAAGIVLDAVAPDHVWLRVNGTRQRVALPSPQPGRTP